MTSPTRFPPTADVFMRPMKLQRVEMIWDGNRMTMQNGGWEGRETLKITDYYE